MHGLDRIRLDARLMHSLEPQQHVLSELALSIAQLGLNFTHSIALQTLFLSSDDSRASRKSSLTVTSSSMNLADCFLLRSIWFNKGTTFPTLTDCSVSRSTFSSLQQSLTRPKRVNMVFQRLEVDWNTY